MKKVVALVAVLVLTACASPEQVAARKASFVARQNAMFDAQRAAAELTCSGKEQCDKMFRIASDATMEMADMKIQTVTPNYISTYNPTDYGRIGMTARRTLSSGNDEVIKLDVNCRGVGGAMPWEDCFDRVATIYKTYKARIDKLK